MAISRILVVDDSPTERFFLSELLVKNGYLVSMAESGEEAVAQAKQTLPDSDRDGCRDARDERLPGHAHDHQGGRDQAYPRHHVHHQRSGNGQGVGHAPGSQGLSGQPVKPEDLLSQIKALG